MHGAKASRNGVSATIPIESGQQRNIPQKTNHHHTDFPEQTAQTAQSALTLRLFGMCSCNDTAVLMDQKKYSSAGGGSPPGLPSLPPALRNKLMIAVAVGTLGVLWSITVWAVHSRKKTLGNFYRHGKPPRVDDLPPLDIAILSGYIGSPEGTFSILDPKPDPHQRQPRGDMLSWAVTAHLQIANGRKGHPKHVNMWVKQSTLLLRLHMTRWVYSCVKEA